MAKKKPAGAFGRMLMRSENEGALNLDLVVWVRRNPDGSLYLTTGAHLPGLSGEHITDPDEIEYVLTYLFDQPAWPGARQA